MISRTAAIRLAVDFVGLGDQLVGEHLPVLALGSSEDLADDARQRLGYD